MMPTILPPAPFCHCMPWHARDWTSGEVHGARCCYCSREVAAPAEAKGKHVACIYCGMDRDEIPAVEIPPEDYEPRDYHPIGFRSIDE